MAGKRNRLYSSRFLAVINPHGLPVTWFFAWCRYLPAGDRRQATRIGHIGVAAERSATGAFN
jgi:hypothetical protein